MEIQQFPYKIIFMFSKATEYGLRATIYIAQKSTEENKLRLPEIARAIHSPKSYTAKILQSLTRDNRIITSSPGPKGGFYITEKTKKLPIRAVLEALGEDEVLEKCIVGLEHCSDKNPCPMHATYKNIKAQLIKTFESKSIQSLANEMEKGRIVIAIS